MRLFLLALFLFIANPALAQTPVSKEMANAYYENCLKQPAPGMTKETQNAMCACTASTYMESMTLEELKLMGSAGPESRQMLNKMIIEVYAPCMEYPTYDYHFKQCVENPKTSTLSSNPNVLCNCMASQVATYLRTNGQSVFRDLLKRNPTMTDPMTALYSDKQFEQFAQSKLLGCLAKNR